MNPVRTSRRLLVALSLVSALFAVAPGIDLAVSGAFFRDGHWLLETWPGMVAFNKGFNTATHWFSGALALLVAVLALRRWQRPVASTALLRATGYLLLVIALGPGLLVNAILKEHWGRPRPFQITEFGGPATYAQVWVPSQGCASNCSFVSGHVAFAAVPVAGAWMASSRRRRHLWFATGLATGALMGFCRVGLGKHFLSDSVIAVLLVALTAALVAALMQRLGAPPADASGTMPAD